MEKVRLYQCVRLIAYVLVILAFLLIPTEFFETHPLCPIYRIFGVRCLTCGMTRAFSNLFHLRAARAVGHNPLVLVLFPLFWVFVLSDLFSFFWRKTGRKAGNLFEFLYKKVFSLPEK